MGGPTALEHVDLDLPVQREGGHHPQARGRGFVLGRGRAEQENRTLAGLRAHLQAPDLLGARLRKPGDKCATCHRGGTLPFDNDPDLVLEPWQADELVIFCAPEHPLAKGGNATTEQLAEQPWILRESGSGTRALFDRAVAPHLATLHVRLQLEHTEAIKRAVEAGLGLACLSRVALHEAFRRGSLVELHTPQFDLQRNFHFVRHRQRHISPASRAFIELCRKVAEGTNGERPPCVGNIN